MALFGIKNPAAVFAARLTAQMASSGLQKTVAVNAFRKYAMLTKSGTSQDANADVLPKIVAIALIQDLHTGMNFGASACADHSTVTLTLNMVEHQELIKASSGYTTPAPALASRSRTACQAMYLTKNSASASAFTTPAPMVSTGTAQNALANVTPKIALLASTGKNHGASADAHQEIATLASTGTTGATLASACQSDRLFLLNNNSGTKSTADGPTNLRNAIVDSSGTTQEVFAYARRSHVLSDSTLTTASMSVAAVASRVFAQPAMSGMMRNAHVCTDLKPALTTSFGTTLMVIASVVANGLVGILPLPANSLIPSSTGTPAHAAVLRELVLITSTSTSKLAHASANPGSIKDSGKSTPTSSSTRIPANSNVLLKLACSMVTTGTLNFANASASDRLAQKTSTGTSTPARACARVNLPPHVPPTSHGTRTAAAAETASK